MKSRAEQVLGLVLALVLLGLMTAKVSSRLGDSPEKRSKQQAQLVHTRQPRLAQNYGKLPLSFELNQGQTDSQVKFLSRGSGYTLFLTGNEAVLSLKKTSAARSKRYAMPVAGRPSPHATGNGLRTADAVLPSLIQNPKSPIQTPPAPSAEESAFTAVRLQFVGANPQAQVVGLDELPGKSNYFIGNDPKKWRTNVPNYSKVKYQNVYPGVDLVYYGSQDGQLEYDFVLAPGANPSVIVLDVRAVREAPQRAHREAPPQIAANGDLVVKTDGGEIRFHRPLVYQTDLPSTASSSGSSLVTHHSSLVDSHYVLQARNQVGFEVASYDHTRPLFIDPVLSYSTYLGGSGYDQGYGITVDSSGNAYVTGYTSSTDFPTTANPLQATYGGGSYDVFVAKLKADGSALVYSTYLGGSGYDYGYGIAVDSSGNAYVTGQTKSTNFPTVNPLQATNKNTNYTAFVASLNSTGSALVYSTYLGGSYADSGNGIAVDSSGNAYVTGYTWSSDFPTVSALQATYDGSVDAFVAKLKADGSALVYSTFLGGSSFDYGQGIAVDSSGNAYVTGYTSSTDFPTASPLQATNHGFSDAFVAKLKADGSALVYSSFLGGSSYDLGYGIAVDSSGNAYVTGSTESTDFPTADPMQSTCSCALYSLYDDAFVAKLNAAGSALVYSTYLGGSAVDKGYGIAVDSSGNAYVTGYTGSTDFPIVNAVQATYQGSPPAFVATLKPDGSALVYSTYLGGSTSYVGGLGTTVGLGIAVDSSSNAYVTGYTNSTDFPTTANPLQANYGYGAYDAFVAMISPDVTFTPSSLTFASQTVGTTSDLETVTLSNSGTGPLTITALTASPSDFAIALPNTPGPTACQLLMGSPLAAGSSCRIPVVFTPSTVGSIIGTLTVTDNDNGVTGSMQTVTLSGTGMGLVVSLSSSSLTFPVQIVGTSSSAQSVTLTNTSSASLAIYGITTAGDFSQTTTCGSTLSAGASCAISVTFSPRGIGTSTGAVIITDNATSSPQTVALSGTGVVFTVGPHPPVVPPRPPALPVPGRPPMPPTVPPTGTSGGTGTEPIVRSPGAIVLPPPPPSLPAPGEPAPPPTVPPTGNLSETGKKIVVPPPGLTVLPLWPPAHQLLIKPLLLL